MDNIEQLAEQVIQAVEVLVDKRLRPITDAIAALRIEVKDAGYLKRDDIAGLAGKDGVDARLAGLDERVRALAADLTARPTLDIVRAESAAAAGKAAADMVAALPKPADGKSVTVDDVRPLLGQMVAALPKAKDGAPGDPGQKGDRGERGEPGTSGAPGQKGDTGEQGPAGKDAVVDYQAIAKTVDELVQRAVADAVAALPVPKDGAPGEKGERGEKGEKGDKGDRGEVGQRGEKGDTGEGGKPGERGEKGDAGDRGPVGERGEKGEQGGAGKDADLATLRDIVAIAVKAAVADIPVPKDGAPGKDAAPVDMDAVASMLEVAVRRAVDALPKPKDGADGFSMKDVSIDLKEDGRTIVFRFLVEGVEKSFEIVCPWQIYREVFKAGTRYQRGDSVTYGGSQWFARKDTTQTPGTGDDWVLAVKRGRDGKDGSSE